MNTFRTGDPAQVKDAAEWILELIRKHDHKYILLHGALGAGKTTAVKNIVRLLGADDVVVSPTFSLHNTYRAGDGAVILHSDLYRLESIDELEQTGFFELIEDADIAFIEWADKFGLKDMLERYMEIRIIKDSETTRVYSAELSDE